MDDSKPICLPGIVAHYATNAGERSMFAFVSYCKGGRLTVYSRRGRDCVQELVSEHCGENMAYIAG